MLQQRKEQRYLEKCRAVRPSCAADRRVGGGGTKTMKAALSQWPHRGESVLGTLSQTGHSLTSAAKCFPLTVCSEPWGSLRFPQCKCSCSALYWWGWRPWIYMSEFRFSLTMRNGGAAFRAWPAEPWPDQPCQKAGRQATPAQVQVAAGTKGKPVQ